MKKIFKSFVVLAMIAGFTSCEDEKDIQYLSPEGEFVILTPTSGDAVELSPATPTNPGISVSWEAVDYGTPTEITYTVQIAKNGTDFATPIDLISTSNTYASVNSEALNGSAIAAGLENDVFGALDVRVRATVGNGAEPTYSNVVNYSVKPYVTYPYRDLYLVGDATAAGWSNDNNNYPLFRDPENEDKYYYTGYFTVGGFKLLEKKGAWQPQWGQNAGVLAVNDGTGSDPSPFDIPTAGYYTFEVDVVANTFSLTSYDASGATVYPTIGIIGTATPGGWENDTDMTQSSFDSHMWYMTAQVLTVGGEMKIRANNGWDVNWGSNTSYTGLGSFGGANIPIGIPTSGTYDVWFNDITGRYIYIPVN